MFVWNLRQVSHCIPGWAWKLLSSLSWPQRTDMTFLPEPPECWEHEHESLPAIFTFPDTPGFSLVS